MNLIRKHMQNGSVKTVIVILALVLGISGGIFALRSATELLTVRADETVNVSPTEPDDASVGQKKDISPSDEASVGQKKDVSPSDEVRKRTFPLLTTTSQTIKPSSEKTRFCFPWRILRPWKSRFMLRTI